MVAGCCAREAATALKVERMAKNRPSAGKDALNGLRRPRRGPVRRGRAARSLELPPVGSVWEAMSAAVFSRLLVFAIGLRCSDHFQPASNVTRPNVTPPTVAISTLPLGKVRVSSGEFKLFFSVDFISYLLDRVADIKDRSLRHPPDQTINRVPRAL
jgi:hypothetical protein